MKTSALIALLAMINNQYKITDVSSCPVKAGVDEDLGATEKTKQSLYIRGRRRGLRFAPVGPGGPRKQFNTFTKVFIYAVRCLVCSAS